MLKGLKKDMLYVVTLYMYLSSFKLVYFSLINLSGSYPMQNLVSFFLRKLATAVHRLNTASASRVKIFHFFCLYLDSFPWCRYEVLLTATARTTLI